MSLSDGGGLFETDKEMTRRRSCVKGHRRSQSQQAPASVQTNESVFP